MKKIALWPLALIVPALVLIGLAWIGPRVPCGPMTAFVIAFSCLGASVLMASLASPKITWRLLALVIVPLLGLLTVSLVPMPEELEAAIVLSSLLAIGTIVGGAVGGRIDKPGHLIVVAILSAMADFFSVMHPQGPTNRIVQSETAMNLMILPWPMLGSDRIAPILGVGDVVFAALYVAACAKHGLSTRRTVVALVIGLIAAMITVIVTRAGIPVLPFFGAAIVIAHPQARRLEGKERRQAVIGLLAIAALIALLFLMR